jgi:hypothetical protein
MMTVLSEEIKILSTLHGQSRRYLCDISKVDLQTAVARGVKTPSYRDPSTKLPHWKYTFGDIVFITDHTSMVEVTSYKQPVTIQPAEITMDARQRHDEVKLILQEEPQLCSTHTIVILD